MPVRRVSSSFILRRRPVFAKPSFGIAAVAVITAGIVFAGCDYGDGRSLDPPTAPLPTTTLPPDSYELTEPESVESAPVDADSDTIAVDLAFELVTPWTAGGEIDRRHTCDSIGVSPALAWTAPPEGTAELALLMTEVVDGSPDLPPVHWVVVGIDAARTSIPEGGLAPGAVMLANSLGEAAWEPPCPTPGTTGEYRFTMYALAEPLGDQASLDTLPLDAVIDLIRFGSMSTAVAGGTVTR